MNTNLRYSRSNASSLQRAHLPDQHLALALAQYRMRANHYDAELAPFESIRREAIARLNLSEGATVLDVGCGTGLSFAQLQTAIGSRGRIVGIEQCPEMLDKARTRGYANGWNNVTLITSPAESAMIPGKADAALLHFTHDILRRSAALRNILQHLKPTASIVASGLCWAPPWEWATNSWVLLAALYSVSSLEGLDTPWNLLAARIGNLEISRSSGIYIASGTCALSGESA